MPTRDHIPLIYLEMVRFLSIFEQFKQKIHLHLYINCQEKVSSLSNNYMMVLTFSVLSWIGWEFDVNFPDVQ